MIKLNDDLVIGKGIHRTCYRHPDKSNLCVKINHKKDSQEQLRELSYYEHLNNRNIPWDLLTRFHGVVNTNKGMGYAFDLVIDPDNQPSKTLEYYLNESALKGIASSLLRLKAYLTKNSIITNELKPRNIACVNKNGITESCVIVDDIGNTEFIPISTYFRLPAKIKINRKWRRFEERLNDLGLPPKKLRGGID